eukprot:TRINITY_DN5511_c0_g1_i2.p1 TRINITY_DN5511_c0_g1~~TRINITY_DN5511_c0_g1_i2.p1  ORF type:complete len:100 (-),score=1.44 TRINITY_DN5511_c0_g1_i2:240-539(-)
MLCRSICKQMFSPCFHVLVFKDCIFTDIVIRCMAYAVRLIHQGVFVQKEIQEGQEMLLDYGNEYINEAMLGCLVCLLSGLFVVWFVCCFYLFLSVCPQF